MNLYVVTDRNEKVALVGNPYFDITDIDGFTEGAVSISSSVLADTDGDVVNAQAVNARDVTITFRFKDVMPVEDAKRYLLRYFKLKKEVVLELDYRGRTSRLTGTVQGISIPRFTLGVSAQVDIHCSSPFWEDVADLVQMISDVVAMHHWPIHPTELEPIIMGQLTDVYQATVVNDGDTTVGMVITITADREVSDPVIMLDMTDLFFKVEVDMEAGDELVIDTRKGSKSVRLNGESIMNRVVAGSTWLQLEIGSNTLVCTNSLDGKGMTYNVTANERYL